MSNFAFIRAEWPELYESCQRAESYVVSDPQAAGKYARSAVEALVDYLFVDVFGLPEPYRSDLNARMNDNAFKVRTSVINAKLNLIRRVGNDAVHEKRRISQQEALGILRHLFDVLVWTVKHHSTFPQAAPLGSAFDEAIVQRRAPMTSAERVALARLFRDEQEAAHKAIAERDARLAAHEAEIATLRAQIAAAQNADTTADTHDYREDDTRAQLIDLLLREAGWALDQPRDREYRVDGMPVIPGVNDSGIGFVDYVLWGSDGLPLAIVEAKRTSTDPSAGAPQAALYADRLEAATGRRPVIFLSNGDRHQVWDDASGYPRRSVAGFFTRDELELMVQRRALRRPLTAAPVDTAIAGRPYQLRAVAKVGEHFDARQRRALLVMATGTGKTRTTVALVKQLMAQGWVRRVLFLADRTALVTQAGRAFSEHLPEVASVDLTADRLTEGRVYLSTYPTMMNLIDTARGPAGERRFGPGFFDLIVIDEAHRSVYRKYGALFDWFDGLLLGLTATPVDDIARSTYRLFGLEPGVPTDSYPLEEAIADGYLVRPDGHAYDLGFHRRGVHYDELSEEEREEWDAIDWDEEADTPQDPPTDVEAARVFRTLFNADTVDKALAELMRHGHHVAGGDRLGKTIVFAKNQRHADFIRERFDAQYPHLGGGFAQVITHASSYAQSLIDDFSQPAKAPHIAISVDMLDTGIDVPEVLNLVLFKDVHSTTKFWQMIGRGTRLAPDVFGDSGDPAHDDKSDFRVFDFCGNLDYFRLDPADRAASVSVSLGQRLFATRVALVSRIAPGDDRGEARASAAAWLRDFVAGIPIDSFLARPHRQLIRRYGDLAAWQESLGMIEAGDLAASLGPLPTAVTDDDEQAKRFDLIVLRRELAQLEGDDATAARTRAAVQQVARLLLEKQTIPQVRDQTELLEELIGDDWWDGVTLAMLEHARRALRGLAQFLDKRTRRVVVVDWEDEVGAGRAVDLPLVAVGVDQARFREKVTAYIRSHLDHLAIQRLRRNQPLTHTDLSELERILIEQGEGTPEALARVTGERGLGIFIRSLVGLDRSAAEAAFAARLAFGGLTATQMDFLRMVVDELTRRGEMDPRRLFDSPYTDRQTTRIDYAFPDEKHQQVIVDVLRAIEDTARPAA
ncbi:DEAD/DEAH box helicase family protein [Microbacterium marinilacus]|uniref:DEAD/DEAH box helicase family protein n=1 Tax=Microbacterium marinilacus TaxID=415209 RepID=UPI001C8E01A7|nr:DEAD/DEAH box helicase family protein [Microbacterium marinilacus]MBY0688255.1 DEAD/DEAH box helicase family protein [Microbacterium marinilacus]